MIADKVGTMPACLKREADWQQFQAALDRASVVVLGRKAHEKFKNPGRKRLVVSKTTQGDDAFYWDPALIPFDNLKPEGVIAVTGVFDVFLEIGYDAFILSEVSEIIEGGIPCFSQGHPHDVLTKAGLERVSISNPEPDLTISIWKKQ